MVCIILHGLLIAQGEMCFLQIEWNAMLSRVGGELRFPVDIINSTVELMRGLPASNRSLFIVS